MPDYIGMVQTWVQRKQTDAETVAAEEATKASQANVTSWEEVQEQPSDDSSNRDGSVEQLEMLVVKQQVEEPGEWLDEEVSDLPVLAEDLFLPDRPARKKLTHRECRRQRQYAISWKEEPADYRLLRRAIRHWTSSERVS